MRVIVSFVATMGYEHIGLIHSSDTWGVDGAAVIRSELKAAVPSIFFAGDSAVAPNVTVDGARGVMHKFRASRIHVIILFCQVEATR